MGAIWIHAVSVGEALSSITLARRLKEAYPDRPLIISTTTNTGQALARERLPFADAVIYFPLDWAFCVRRALDAARPSVVLVLETEIWPNFLREAGRRKIPVLFRQRTHIGSLFCTLSELSRSFWLFPASLPEKRTFQCHRLPDAERERCGSRAGAGRTCGSRAGQRKFEIRPGTSAPTPLSNWLRNRRSSAAADRQSLSQEASLRRRSHTRSSRSELCKASIQRRCLCLRPQPECLMTPQGS